MTRNQKRQQTGLQLLLSRTTYCGTTTSSLPEIACNCCTNRYEPYASWFTFQEKEINRPDRHVPLRSQSIRALLEIPHIAEQHSRELVPLFLSLETSSSSSSVKWSRKDRISLLTLFT